MKLTGGRGVDTAIEAVGIPATFELCEEIVAPGGTIANIGVHGTKVDLHLERLWDHNITITTRLVDTVTHADAAQDRAVHKIDPKLLITHRFKLDQHPRGLRDLRQRRQAPRRSRSSSRPRRDCDETVTKETASAWGYMLRPSIHRTLGAVASGSI